MAGVVRIMRGSPEVHAHLPDHFHVLPRAASWEARCPCPGRTGASWCPAICTRLPFRKKPFCGSKRNQRKPSGISVWSTRVGARPQRGADAVEVGRIGRPETRMRHRAPRRRSAAALTRRSRRCSGERPHHPSLRIEDLVAHRERGVAAAPVGNLAFHAQFRGGFAHFRRGPMHIAPGRPARKCAATRRGRSLHRSCSRS